MKKFNIVFLGTPDFSVPSLEVLHNHPLINIVNIISMPDRKSGRGLDLKSPEVIEFAKNHKLPFFQTSNINQENEFLASLEKENIDIIIVLAFAQFLGERILKLPKIACFNIHTSLLPKYRGAAPIQYALLNGDPSTGVSIQKMVKKMDAGDIAWSQPVNIYPNETGGQLYTRLKFQAALSLNEFIYALIENKISYTAQDETNVSFAPTLARQDGFLDFKNSTFQQIINKVNALYPWPGTYCFLDKKRLKVMSACLESKKLQPGEVSTDHSTLLIGCKDASIRLLQVQFEGKKPSSDITLLNGIKTVFNINP
jgi:methionyl-tRNA formyltransferase